MSAIKKPYHYGAQDAAANRVFQAFERLQIAWYTVNARRPVHGDSQLDESAVTELKAAEEEWFAARTAVSIGC